MAKVTSKEKAKAATATEKEVVASKKARVSMEKSSSELEAKLSETELKLAKAASLNIMRAEELANLKSALEGCESKWYDESFVDAENSMEPIINEARKLAFKEGWLAALQAIVVPKDSPLRDPNQIPFPSLSTVTQKTCGVADKETTSLKELVKQIDAHAEPID